MSEKKKELRTLLNDLELDAIVGGNKEITEDTKTDICPDCFSEIVIKNSQSMANHRGSALCIAIQKAKGLL